jgi:hypothetical protein
MRLRRTELALALRQPTLQSDILNAQARNSITNI